MQVRAFESYIPLKFGAKETGSLLSIKRFFASISKRFVLVRIRSVSSCMITT